MRFRNRDSNWRRFLAVGLSVLVTSATTPAAFAGKPGSTSGSLDTSFGTGGKVITTFPGASGQVNAVALQPFIGSGSDPYKIVAVGYACSGGTTATYNCLMAIARYNANGSLDSTFAGGGQFTMQLPSRFAFYNNQESDRANAVMINPNDNHIMVAGQTCPIWATSGGVCQMVLLDLGINGTPDPTSLFGGGTGIVLTDAAAQLGQGNPETGTAGYGNNANALAFDATNNVIYVGGSICSKESANSCYDEFASVAYVRASGAPYANWGTNGVVVNDFGALDGMKHSAAINSLSVDSFFNVYAAGTDSINNTTNRFAVTANIGGNGGALAAFGGSGLVFTSFPNSYGATVGGLSINADTGEITVGGTVTYQSCAKSKCTTSSDMAMARYLTSGTLDPTFGSSGLVTTSFGSSKSAGSGGIAEISLNNGLGGRIVLAGNSGSSFALAAYGENGALDTSFGTNGLVTTSFGNKSTSGAADVAIDPSTLTILAVGGTNADATSTPSAALSRYLP